MACALGRAPRPAVFSGDLRAAIRSRRWPTSRTSGPGRCCAARICHGADSGDRGRDGGKQRSLRSATCRRPARRYAAGGLWSARRIDTGQWERYMVIPEDGTRGGASGLRARPWPSCSRCLRRASRLAAGSKTVAPQEVSCREPWAASTWLQRLLRWLVRVGIQGGGEVPGHWQSGTDGQAFLGQIAAEVNAACNSGQLACGPARSSLEAPARPQYMAETLGMLPAALERLFRGDGIGSGTSIGDVEGVIRMAHLVRSQVTARDPSAPVVSISGWVAGQSGAPQEWHWPHETLTPRRRWSQTPRSRLPETCTKHSSQWAIPDGTRPGSRTLSTNCPGSEWRLWTITVDGEEVPEVADQRSWLPVT